MDATVLYVTEANRETINTLENFSNLEVLYAEKLALRNITVKDCSKLREVHLGENELVDFQVVNCPQVEFLALDDNNLAEINLALPKLKTMYCKNNFNLQKLQVGACTSLDTINCSRGKLKSLDLRTLSNLRNLDCSRNELEVLLLPERCPLKSLYCEKNKLSVLPVLNFSQLKEFSLAKNKFTELNLSGLRNLNYVSAYENSLRVLRLADNVKLKDLDCEKNQLREINLDACNELKSLNISHNNFEKLPLTPQQIKNIEFCSYRNNPIQLSREQNEAFQKMQEDDDEEEIVHKSNYDRDTTLFTQENNENLLNQIASIEDKQQICQIICDTLRNKSSLPLEYKKALFRNFTHHLSFTDEEMQYYLNSL